MVAVARLTILSLVSTMVIGLSGAARAADLLPPAPSLDAVDQVVELGTGWYLRGDIGYVDYNSPHDVGFGVPGTLPLDGERLEKTWSAGGGIGYQITNWLRADATVDYRFGSEFSGTRPNPTYAIGYIRDQADLESTTLLLNGYLDLGYWAGVTPYIGAGIGVSGNRFTDLSRDFYVGDILVASAVLDRHTSYNLAWALMAGVTVNAGAGFALDLGYRYLNLGDVRTRIDAPGVGIKTEDLQSHEFRFGARYMID
jgi:opacity protein-like surface antigen